MKNTSRTPSTSPPQSPSPAARRTRRLAHLLDTLIRIPGTRMRFGLDPVLGLIPGAGDAVGTVLSGYIIVEAIRAGASRAVLLRMLTNLGIDALLSLIPLLGDLLDAGWKANSRNLSLLQRHLTNPAGAAAASRTFNLVVVLALCLLVLATVGLAVITVRWFVGLF